MPISRGGFEVIPDPKVNPLNTVAAILGGHPVGGPQPVSDPEGMLWTEKVKDDSGEAMQDYVRHARNFIDCIKSRQQPISDLESGHRIATACHLANISLRTGRKIVWDAEREEIVDDKAASRMLARPYREKWATELRAAGARV
jgi:hypothetical protein